MKGLLLRFLLGNRKQPTPCPPEPGTPEAEGYTGDGPPPQFRPKPPQGQPAKRFEEPRGRVTVCVYVCWCRREFSSFELMDAHSKTCPIVPLARFAAPVSPMAGVES